MEALPYRLNRSVSILAAPETVFEFFTDSARWARWWGAGSTIDPRPGGKMLIRYPDGSEAAGEVKEVAPPERIVFTYGYASGKHLAPGASLVTIRLTPEGRGTRLELVHEFAEAAVRDMHVQGWRFQLSLFANVVADQEFADAAALVDGWFAAWAIADDRTRDEAFTRVAEEHVRFRDRYSQLEGLADLSAHAAGAQRFMAGVRLERRGEVRHCQGVVLADWSAKGPDGQERMSGTNVFVISAGGRFEAVTGCANPPARS